MERGLQDEPVDFGVLMPPPQLTQQAAWKVINMASHIKKSYKYIWHNI